MSVMLLRNKKEQNKYNNKLISNNLPMKHFLIKNKKKTDEVDEAYMYLTTVTFRTTMQSKTKSN